MSPKNFSTALIIIKDTKTYNKPNYTATNSECAHFTATWKLFTCREELCAPVNSSRNHCCHCIIPRWHLGRQIAAIITALAEWITRGLRVHLEQSLRSSSQSIHCSAQAIAISGVTPFTTFRPWVKLLQVTLEIQAQFRIMKGWWA